ATMPPTRFVARCSCGQVEIEADGPPIAHISCYCDDCQRAADIIDALPGGESLRDADGGTPNLLFRKDRVRCTRGADLLDVHKVRDDTWTNRFVASCCNTAVMQRHDNWWPHQGIKPSLLTTAVPPIEFRIYTKYAPDLAAIPRDAIVSRTVSARFGLRLLRAAVALRFARKRPER
ncbi:MAG TPA: hypothetical protein VML75_25080, partial [Kofleriaceae bacterium]|nr:hypothetical protein [Kofleriaceae bacterium]